MNKQPEITEITRKTFIDVFCGLYARKPIEKITVQEIAKIAGYNRSTFYQYFTDVYDLLSGVENDILNYLKAEMENDNSYPSVQKINRLFEEKGNVLNALFGEYGNVRFITNLMQELPDDHSCLNFSAEEKVLPYLNEFYISTSLSLFRLWLKRNKDLTPEEFYKLVDILYTSGIESFTEK